MIRHCVFFRFRADVADSERKEIFAELADLRAHVDGMLDANFGRNVSPEGLGKGLEDGFVIDFRDVAARDAYLVHEAHQKAGARLVAAIDGGLDTLLVFDLEVG